MKLTELLSELEQEAGDTEREGVALRDMDDGVSVIPVFEAEGLLLGDTVLLNDGETDSEGDFVMDTEQEADDVRAVVRVSDTVSDTVSDKEVDSAAVHVVSVPVCEDVEDNVSENGEVNEEEADTVMLGVVRVSLHEMCLLSVSDTLRLAEAVNDFPEPERDSVEENVTLRVGEVRVWVGSVIVAEVLALLEAVVLNDSDMDVVDVCVMDMDSVPVDVGAQVGVTDRLSDDLSDSVLDKDAE